MSPRLEPRRRRVRGRALTGILIAVAVVCVAAVGVVVGVAVSLAAPDAPGVGTVVLAPPDSTAAEAADDAALTDEQRAAADYLAAQPSASWLTPERDPIGAVGDTVAALASAAQEQEVALALVVYGLPERDCGSHSAGGLSAPDYPVWIDEIATALHATPDLQRIVVLEPDSLALAPECGNLDDRVPQLSSAIEALDAPDVWIYVDGGHSSWLPAAQMADLIDDLDAGDALRGFATNVSNYQPTSAEFAYAHEVSRLTGGLHAIVDTSRNGAATAGSEWCNPPGQRVGDPGGTYGDDVVDTNLWIKTPGESDGVCNGGPDAGAYWPEQAVELTADAR